MNMAKLTLLVGTFAVLGVTRMAEAATSTPTTTYFNEGQVLVAPQIDAPNFINQGLITLSTGVPFYTRNTLNYLNLGEMTGVPGFDFQTISSTGVRRLAASFTNGSSGVIRVQNPLPLGSAVNATLSVRATNIVNQGELTSDVTGVVRLEGKSVNLTRSSVGIRPIVGGVGTNGPTSFSPDVGVIDSYWGVSSNDTAPIDALVLQGSGGRSRVISPIHTLSNQYNQALTYVVNLPDALPFVRVSQPDGSNYVIQGVFVQRQDPRLAVDVRFSPSADPSNLYETAVVRFARAETNALTGLLENNLVYLIDELVSGTNGGLSTNVATRITYRPANYIVTRETSPIEWLAGQPANETDSRFLTFPGASALGANSIPSLFYNTTYTNDTAPLGMTAYHFAFTNIIAAIPTIPGASVANQPGRVEITADTLTLTRARIRAEGIVNLKINNFKPASNSNAVIDVPNLALDLNSDISNLVISNLVRTTVDRTTGPIFAWSGSWSNSAVVRSSTFIPDTNNPGMFVEQFTTNNASIRFHLLMVDSRQVATTLPVYVPSFSTASTNLTVYDTLRLTEAVNVRSKNLTIAPSGNLLMAGAITNWNANLFTNLSNLTNRGKISFGGTIGIGAAPARSFQRIVNSGQIGGVEFSFRAGYFENSGSISRVNIQAPSTVVPPARLGAIRIEATETRLVGGQIGDATSAGVISLTANNLTLSNQAITTPSSISFLVTNRITDSGGNSITARNISLLSTPRSGDLLGTTINSTVPARFGINQITWAGRDRGPQLEGFTNNSALNRLVLKGAVQSLHQFQGAGEGNALYVKTLELQTMTFSQLQDLLQLDGDFKLYFQDSTPYLPEQLDQVGSNYFGGRLKWVPAEVVPEEASANSRNKIVQGAADSLSLTSSTPITQDAVGSSVGLPVDGLKFTSVALANGASEIHLSWSAAPGISYTLEFATDLLADQWQLLGNYSNPSSESRAAMMKDTTASGVQRFYRLRTQPR